MNITVYLPDEIGRRAKAADLPLSRMLRDAILAHFREQEERAAVERMMQHF